jgi:heme exporter protein A
MNHAARLSVERLSLARGGRVLFEGVSFRAGPGDFVDIRGPNGAGKTSLLRAIAGFLRPAAGAIGIDGAEEPELALHFLGHQDGLKPSLDGRAHAAFWAGLLGGAAGEALVRVGLGAIADLPARALSQGQRRRLALARLIAAPRPLWLLDEPAAALDAAGRGVLDAMIEAHRREGGVVLAALHEALGAAPSATVQLGEA